MVKCQPHIMTERIPVIQNKQQENENTWAYHFNEEWCFDTDWSASRCLYLLFREMNTHSGMPTLTTDTKHIYIANMTITYYHNTRKRVQGSLKMNSHWTPTHATICFALFCVLRNSNHLRVKPIDCYRSSMTCSCQTRYSVIISFFGLQLGTWTLK